MELIRADSLPENALDACAEFTAQYLPEIERKLLAGSDVMVHLPKAGSDHSDWRRAMARDLARKYAPMRVVIIGGNCDGSADAAFRFAADNPAITGQYLLLNDGDAAF